MNLSRIALVLGVGFVVVGCTAQVTIKPKTRYVNAPDTVLDAKADWTGQSIIVEIDGVGFAEGSTAGLQVYGDPSLKRVKATARVVARADDGARTDADLSIGDAVKTFTMTEDATSIRIKCGHGGAHGSSSAGDSGCEGVTVNVPGGSSTAPVVVQATVGNGDLVVKGITGSVTAKNNGAGDVDVTVTPIKGSTVDASSGFDVIVRLPATFAADSITLSGKKLDTADFPDVTSGKGRGNAGEGAKSITVASSSGLDSTVVALKKQ